MHLVRRWFLDNVFAKIPICDEKTFARANRARNDLMVLFLSPKDADSTEEDASDKALAALYDIIGEVRDMDWEGQAINGS